MITTVSTHKKTRRRRKIRKQALLLRGVLLIVFFLLLSGLINLNRWITRLIQEGSGAISNAMWEELSSDEYPESLRELAKRNPEARSFVLDYPEKKDLHPDIDLKGEVKKGTIPLFLQWDERWGYETYGDDMIAITGCGPTCLSMVRCGLSGDTQWNPLAVAQMAEENGYYQSGAGSAWSLMSEGASRIGLTATELPLDESRILAALESGSPIICVMGPGDFTTTGHFIVLTGVDKHGKIIVNDPNSKEKSNETWDLDTLIPQMKNLWSYSYEA